MVLLFESQFLTTSTFQKLFVFMILLLVFAVKVQRGMSGLIKSLQGQPLEISVGPPGRGRLTAGGKGDRQRQQRGVIDTRPGGAYIQGPGQRVPPGQPNQGNVLGRIVYKR